MNAISRRAFAPYSCAQMFALVNDVRAYPAFLPWCAEATVLAETAEAMRARLAVRKGPLALSFTTDNRLRVGQAIDLELVDGPFEHLRGQWRFTPADGGCVVGLDLEFAFGGRVGGALLARAFKPLADSLVEAFTRRAREVYGTGRGD
jgi:ribosome-associated toxin RatA of RatAB toxin-antitoxin module